MSACERGRGREQESKREFATVRRNREGEGVQKKRWDGSELDRGNEIENKER